MTSELKQLVDSLKAKITNSTDYDELIELRKDVSELLSLIHYRICACLSAKYFRPISSQSPHE